MTEEIELRKYLWMLWRWLWLIVLCTVLAAGGALFFSLRMDPTYSASVTLLVYQAPSAAAGDYNAIVQSERLARTYSKMITGRPVLEEVVKQVDMGVTADGLAQRVRVDPIQDTHMIRISVEDANPERAALLANTIADVFIVQNRAIQEERFSESLANVQEQIDRLSALIEDTQTQIDVIGEPADAQEQAEITRLETILASYRTTYASLLQNYEQMRLTAAQSTNNVVVFEPARPPAMPIRPRTANNVAVAAVAGLVLAIAIAFLIEYLDDTIKTPQDVRQALGLTVLGSISRLENGDAELVVAANPTSAVAENFRILRTNLWFSGVDRPLKTIQITSAGPSEGKTIIAANLAVAIAQAGQQVLLVDADLRRPRIHKLFDIHTEAGFPQALMDSALDGRLVNVERVDGLKLLPAGPLPPNPAEMLASRRMGDLLSELTRQWDVVLFDSSPVLPVADASVLASRVDGVVLVVDAGRTRRALAQRAVENLLQVDAAILGVVLNGVPQRGGYSYYYYYGDEYYRHGEGSDGHKGRRRRKKRTRTGVRLPWKAGESSR